MSHLPQRLDLAFKIKWEAGWHVGSGLSSAAIDRLQRRRVCGERAALAAFVPGSQIKGVLRHHCERLAATLGAVPVSPHVVGDPRPEILDNFCPLDQSKLLIDRLFGNRFQGECLFVNDATPCDDKPQYSSTQSRTSIDRVTGTARTDPVRHRSGVAPKGAGTDQQSAGAARSRRPHPRRRRLSIRIRPAHRRPGEPRRPGWKQEHGTGKVRSKSSTVPCVGTANIKCRCQRRSGASRTPIGTRSSS